MEDWRERQAALQAALKEERLVTLHQERAVLIGDMELAADVGDRAIWEKARGDLRRVEDEIFALSGLRPPYGTGWGGLSAELGFDPTSTHRQD